MKKLLVAAAATGIGFLLAAAASLTATLIEGCGDRGESRSNKPLIERVVIIRESGREELAPTVVIANPDGSFRVYVREGVTAPPE